MVSKGEWGIGYLAGTGVSLIIILIWWFAIKHSPTFTAFVGTITGIILSSSLIYLAYWLTTSGLDSDHIWSVARWGAIGLALPTLPLTAITLVGVGSSLETESSVLVTIAAASAVIGALFGAVTELEREHRQVVTLNHRNTVLNRVLRHDIRNDASVLLVVADRLEDECTTAAQELAVPIREKTNEILELSQRAKRVESLNQATETHPVNVVDIVTDQVATIEHTHPTVAIECDLPQEAWVRANELLGSVIDNLLENAIQHTNNQPEIHISVTTPPTVMGDIEICVADNGPGIPPEIAHSLSDQDSSDTTGLTDRVGLGLWLVKWYVETYDGKLTIEENSPQGTIIRIFLPRSVPHSNCESQTKSPA